MKTSWTSLVAGLTSGVMLLSQSGALWAAQPVEVETKTVPVPAVAPLNPLAPPPPGYLTGPARGDALDIALSYLRANKTTYGFTDTDIADFVVARRYTSAHNGLTHLYLVQRWQGIEVFNGSFNFNIDTQGRILYVGNRWAPNLAHTANTAKPTLTAYAAVEKAAAHMGLTPSAPLTVLETKVVPDQATLFSDAGISQNPIPANLVYDTTGKHPRLAWNVIIYAHNDLEWLNIRVDATTGDILSENNWVVNDHWGEAHAADAVQHATETAHVTAATTAPVVASLPITPVVDGSSYKVYQWPVESPIHTSPLPPADGRITVTQPADALGSPFGWHDTNGVAGAEFTTTVGNNVQAYTDVDANNVPDTGSSPSGGAGLDFIFPLDLTQAPSAYRPAAVTNLFYWNNLMHDIPYRYGFTEQEGNFQLNNYGRGGTGNDSVLAEAQDGSGFNNANFGTPADGSRPRMQMYLWDAPTPDRDGDLDNGIIAHEYGHGISNRLTGNSVNCLDNNEQMGEGWSDWQSIFMTMKPGEDYVTGRGIGTYALNQATTGPGIRPARYSTSLTVNNYTYANLGSLAIPHGVGFMWNTMLYEMNAALVARYGFNPDLYGAWHTGGNNLAYQLVTDGMKIQPCSPGFVDGRNAILAADQALTGGVNQCTIWAAFAKRGLGFSASQGSNNSTTDGTAAFNMPPSCNFLTTPAAQNVCQSQSAVYAIQVGAGFTAPVTMSVSGNPAPTTANFAPNPMATLPNTTVLTIGNTGTAPAGTYSLQIRGNNVATQAVTATLSIFAGTPAVPVLSSPANGATNVSLGPTLSWNTVAGAASYFVQVATDAGFTNVVYSATVAGASTTVPTLSGNTTYHWRVRATNPCGTGTFAAAFSFTTLPLFCVSPNLVINDNTTVTSTMVVTFANTLTDLNVFVSGTHTYVGDLIFNVSKQAGPTVNLLNQPGGGNCGNNNFDPELDDEGPDGSVQNQCRATPTALFGRPTPNSALTAFDGLAFNGTWSLSVRDTALQDTGVLQRWCLVPTFPSAAVIYGVGMTPPTAGQAGNPGQVVTYTLTVTNTGNASDTYTVTLNGNAFSTNAPTSVGPLAAGASTTFNVVVTIPGGAVGGATDTANINVRSQGDPTKQANAALTTTVNTVRGLSLTPSTAGQAGNPGQVLTYTLRVTNTGNASDTFTVALSGNVFSTNAPTSVGPLAAGASTTFNVVVTIPGGAAGGATDTANVNVTSQGDPTKQASAALTTTVNTVRGLSLTPPTANQTGSPGQVLTYTLRVTNTGNASDTFTVALAGNVFNTNAPTSVGPLAAGASTTFNVVVTIPGGAAGGATDTANVTVTSQGDPTKQASTALTTTVNASWSVSLTPPTAGQSGNPGQVVTYTLTVTNTGNASDTFTVTLSGNAFNTNAPASVGPLASGASTTFNVVVTIPGGAAGGATDTVNVTLTSQGNAVAQADADLTTTVNAIYGVSLALANPSQANYVGEVVTYTFTLTNSGNTTDTYTVNLAGNVFTTTAPASVGPLAAGASTTFNVVVAIPFNVTNGQLDTTNVTVTSQGNNTVSSNTNIVTQAWWPRIYISFVWK